MSAVTAEQNLGLSVLNAIKKALGDDWADVSEAHRINAAAVGMDYAALVLRATWGADVREALSEVGVAIAQWEWIGEDVARRAMLDAVEFGLELGVKAAAKALSL